MDLEIGRILRQILERGLYHELGFGTFEDYVVERLDLSPRTARRLVRLARAPEAVATAFREGRITFLQTEASPRGKTFLAATENAGGGQGCAGPSRVWALTTFTAEVAPRPIGGASTAAQRAEAERTRGGTLAGAWPRR